MYATNGVTVFCKMGVIEVLLGTTRPLTRAFAISPFFYCLAAQWPVMRYYGEASIPYTHYSLETLTAVLTTADIVAYCCARGRESGQVERLK